MIPAYSFTRPCIPLPDHGGLGLVELAPQAGVMICVLTGPECCGKTTLARGALQTAGDGPCYRKLPALLNSARY